MTLKAQIETHLEARWEYLGKRNWQGSISKRTYFARNAPHIRRNVLNGAELDGRGGYVQQSIRAARFAS